MPTGKGAKRESPWTSKRTKERNKSVYFQGQLENYNRQGGKIIH